MHGYKKIINHIRYCYRRVERLKKEGTDENGKIANPFRWEIFYVHTNVKDFTCPYRNVQIHDYHELGDRYVRWIETTQQRLLSRRTRHERLFASILSQSRVAVIEQPYFNVDGKGYFLDFFFPKYNIAFELNGKVHSGEKGEEYDFQRDLAFHSIGIKTVRVSNLDIEASDIKEKVNNWVRLAMDGRFDPALYYTRCDSRKFDGKETNLQKIHRKLNDAISQEKYRGKRILVIPDNTYFNKVLGSERYDASEMINKKHIDQFFDIVESHEISVGFFNKQNLDKLPRNLAIDCVEKNNEATSHKVDYVLRISGGEVTEEEYKYPNVRPIQSKFIKTRAGDAFYAYKCPYNIFYPYRKKDCKSHKTRTYNVCAGGDFCHLCKFHNGKDVDKDIIFCTGFTNKGSRNFYDNLSLNYESLAERYQEYLDYKKTEEYADIMSVLQAKAKKPKKEKYNHPCVERKDETVTKIFE